MAKYLLYSYEEEFEKPLTKQNELLVEQNGPLEDILEYLNASIKVFYNQRQGTFMVNNTTTLLSYISNPPKKIHYLNFIYKDLQFIISYNFPHKAIVVYMGGRMFDEKEVEFVKSKIPRISGYKIITNTKTSSFRYNAFRDKKDYSKIITNNIIKIISNYPIDFKDLVSSYISKSYNFGPRLNLPLQLEALHKNIGLFYFSSTFIYSPDKKYIVVLRHFSPSPGLIVSLNPDSILINIYDWSDNLIRVIEAPPFEIHNVSDISVFILEAEYEMNFDECYDIILRSLTSFYLQSKPLNNNSPSSE